MTAKTLISRLAVFFLGLPLMLLIAWLPYFNHLGLHVLIILFAFLGSNELYTIFSKRIPLLPRPFLVGLSVLLPVSSAFHSVFPAITQRPLGVGQEIVTYFLIASVLLILAAEVFTAKEFSASNARMAGSVFIVIYTGYLITFVSRLTVFSSIINGERTNVSTAYCAAFLMMVFLCDSIAWFFGVLLGRSNRGIVAASPNKSIMGFIGGLAGSMGAGALAWFIWRDVFAGSILKMLAIGAVLAFSSIVGDLAESVFKRCADVKDSGRAVPGRGGALDSLDSILMSAPVFYALVSIIYHPGLF